MRFAKCASVRDSAVDIFAIDRNRSSTRATVPVERFSGQVNSQSIEGMHLCLACYPGRGVAVRPVS